MSATSDRTAAIPDGPWPSTRPVSGSTGPGSSGPGSSGPGSSGPGSSGPGSSGPGSSGPSAGASGLGRAVRGLGRGVVRGVAGLSVLVAALLLGAVAVGGEQNIAVALLAALAGWVPVLLVVGLGAAAMGRARALLVTSGVLLVVSLVWQQPFPADVWRGAEAAGGRTDVTVLALNMKFGHADPAQLLAQVQRTRPDVVVLTELTLDAAADLRAGGLDRLLPYSQAEGRFDASGTGVWSRYPLGSPQELAGTRYVGIQATLTIAGRPVALTAVHPSAPTEIAQWTADYERITAAVQRSIAEPGVTQIVAGDLNASSGNGPLRRLLATGLDDAAASTSWSWSGLTWPADRPFPPLTRIDHVLTSPDATAQSVSTFSIAGTDHRGVVARLSIPRG